MQYFEWGHEKQNISTICLGTMLMGSMMDREESFKALDHFVDLGGNFLDTANCYAWWTGTGQFIGDESETLLGEWLTRRGGRDRLVISTKVGARIRPETVTRNPDGTVDWSRYDAWGNYEGLSAQTIISAVEGSLKRLKTDYIDIYLTHVDYRTDPLEETLAAMDRLVREGKVRHIGASNMRSWRLEEARQTSLKNGWAPYEVIQNEFSYIRPKRSSDSDRFIHTGIEYLDYLKSRPEIMHMAYSPLLKGVFVNDGKRETRYIWDKFNTPDTEKRLQALKTLSGETGHNENNLVLAWMMAKTAPRTVPILGFSKLQQYLDNIKCLEITLSAEQIARLDQAGD